MFDHVFGFTPWAAGRIVISIARSVSGSACVVASDRAAISAICLTAEVMSLRRSGDSLACSIAASTSARVSILMLLTIILCIPAIFDLE